jgi:hypothetical protein
LKISFVLKTRCCVRWHHPSLAMLRIPSLLCLSPSESLCNTDNLNGTSSNQVRLLAAMIVEISRIQHLLFWFTFLDYTALQLAALQHSPDNEH